MTPTKIWRLKRKKEIKRKISVAALNILAAMLLVIMIVTRVDAAQPCPEEMTDGELYKVECTAYYNKYNSACADGSWPKEGLTVAGPEEWLGCTCIMYTEDMDFIGFFEFRDTGYGQATGHGESRVLPGKTLGTIEAGECIDVYIEDYERCMEWGRKTVYIQVIQSVG